MSVPADLDLVVRLDLERLRSIVSREVFSALEQRIRDSSGEDAEAETGRWLLKLLQRADTAWIAVRPGLAPELTDSVVVLRGHFSDAQGQMPNPPWGERQDLGGLVLRFERRPSKLRSAPVVAVLRAPDRVILGTVAEVDALDRVLDGHGDLPLRASESGVISLAARLASLKQRLGERAPSAARLLEGATRADAKLDRLGDKYPVELELTFETPEQAADFAQAATRVRGALATAHQAWIERIQIQPLQQYVTLRLELSEQDLLRGVGCLLGTSCSS